VRSIWDRFHTAKFNLFCFRLHLSQFITSARLVPHINGSAPLSVNSTAASRYPLCTHSPFGVSSTFDDSATTIFGLWQKGICPYDLPNALSVCLHLHLKRLLSFHEAEARWKQSANSSSHDNASLYYTTIIGPLPTQPANAIPGLMVRSLLSPDALPLSDSDSNTSSISIPSHPHVCLCLVTNGIPIGQPPFGYYPATI
jgi:hypothetical protein